VKRRDFAGFRAVSTDTSLAMLSRVVEGRRVSSEADAVIQRGLLINDGRRT